MSDESEIMNSSILKKVRHAGYQKTITDTEKVDLSRVCTTLDQHLDSMELQPCKLPLETLSIQINGLAKLYKAQANNLLKECYEMDMNMAIRKTRKVKFDIGSNLESCDLNVSLENSNQDLGEEYCEGNNDSSLCKRKRCRSAANNCHKEKRSYSGSSTDSSKEMYQSIGDDPNQNSEIMSNLDAPTVQENKETHDKSIQTNNSFLNNLHSNRVSANASCDNDLPFGYVMIFDNRNDRLPRKILYSSFDPRVMNL